MGKETTRTARVVLSGQTRSYVECKTLAADPEMAAILFFTPKDPSKPFVYFMVTFIPRDDKFKFFIRRKGADASTPIATIVENEWLSDYDVRTFERGVTDWICTGGLNEMLKIIRGVYHSHVKETQLNR